MDNSKKILDCQYCKKYFPINDMYSCDACCEEHQKQLNKINPINRRPKKTHIVYRAIGLILLSFAVVAVFADFDNIDILLPCIIGFYLFLKADIIERREL